MNALDYVKSITIEDVIKDITPRGNGKSVKTNKPKNGAHAYIWRMVRFHAGIDTTMPITCTWYLEDKLEEITGNKYRFSVVREGSEEKEVLNHVDQIVDDVIDKLGLNKYKAALTWKSAGLF